MTRFQSRGILTLIQFATAWCLFLACNAFAGQPQEELQKPNAPPASAAAPSVPPSRVVLSIPPMLDENEIRRYAQLLTLSEPQRMFLGNLYKQFSIKCEEMNKTDLAELDVLSISLAARENTMIHDRAYAEANQAFWQKQRAIAKKIIDFEDSLFAQLQTVLAEPQLAVFSRVQMHRQRARCVGLNRDIRSSKIDLSRLIEAFQLDESVLQDLDPVLVEYETALTPMYVALEKTTFDNADKVHNLLVHVEFRDNGERIAPGTPESAARWKEFYQHRRELVGEGVRLQKRIAELNEVFVVRLKAVMTGETGMRLGRVYLEMVYPRVHRMENDPADLIATIKKAEIFELEQRELFEAFWMEFQGRYESTCGKMRDECDRWDEQKAYTAATFGFDAWETKMRQWRNDRWDLTMRILKEILSIPAPKLEPHFGPEIREFIHRVEEAQSRAVLDKYPGP